jgi:hypothetical protein
MAVGSSGRAGAVLIKDSPSPVLDFFYKSVEEQDKGNSTIGKNLQYRTMPLMYR